MVTGGELAGHLSFPNSKMTDLDLVTFKCHFREDISHFFEYTGQGWEKEDCHECLMRENGRPWLWEIQQHGG